MMNGEADKKEDKLAASAKREARMLLPQRRGPHRAGGESGK